jgi:hypothetical protein
MMNNVPSTVRRFLDIEAQVGNEEDNDEDGDHGLPGELTLVFSMSAPLTSVCILDDFIDDQDCGRPEDAPQLPEGQLPDQDEERLHDLLMGILQRLRNRSAQQASSRYDGNVNSDNSDTPVMGVVFGLGPEDPHFSISRPIPVMSYSSDPTSNPPI